MPGVRLSIAGQRTYGPTHHVVVEADYTHIRAGLRCHFSMLSVYNLEMTAPKPLVSPLVVG